jgi:hypothetical protein
VKEIQVSLRLGAFALTTLAAVATASAQPAEGPAAGWEDDLQAAVTRAREEQKLVLQFRLIGRFDRPDC